MTVGRWNSTTPRRMAQQQGQQLQMKKPWSP
jgi:hypothetical protein